MELIATGLIGQQSYAVTFDHDGKTVFGTFLTPDGVGTYPTIIIAPGSGPNDRDATLPMIGGNIMCLYPGLLGDTLKSYRHLAEALVDSGFAVLRYDKLEYTYPTTLAPITFHKLWLPFESAIDYLKGRDDVDPNKIILLGHSEGAALIPFVAKERNDIKALISVAGARTPFDSLLAFQIVNITRMCNGDTLTAKFQANQILSYFNVIRTNTWNFTTPTLFGVPASAWYDYVIATDPVATHYNEAALPTLFLGMELDINVPPDELNRFRNEVTITDDFWSIPDLNHYLTPNDDPRVSEVVSDTIIYWLRQQVLSSTEMQDNTPLAVKVFPNPFDSTIIVSAEGYLIKEISITVQSIEGRAVYRQTEQVGTTHFSHSVDLSLVSSGVYMVTVQIDDKQIIKEIVKK